MAITYNIYRDDVLVGTTTEKTFQEHVPPGTYEYRVTAVDESGNESGSPPPAEIVVVTTVSFAWDGSEWVSMAGAMIYDGSEWQPWANAMIYDGDSWVAT